MAEVVSRAVAEELIANDGKRAGYPDALDIYELRDKGSSDVYYSVRYSESDYNPSAWPYVDDYLPLWSQETGPVEPIGQLGAG